MTPSDAPPTAKNWLERTVFVLGGVLTTLTLGGLVYQAVSDGGRDAPRILVRLGTPEPRADRFAVPVFVENRGDETAEAVHIEVTLTTDGSEERADFEIAFVPGHGTRKGAVTFDSDPTQGTLRARPVGYEHP